MDGLDQQRPAGVCRAEPTWRRFLPDPVPFPVGGDGEPLLWPHAQRQQPGDPVQSPTRRAMSCCSSEEGVRRRHVSSCTSAWVGSDLLVPLQGGHPTLGCNCSGPQIRPPQVGSPDLSRHKPRGVPTWRCCYPALEKLPKHFEPLWLSPPLCHWSEDEALKSLKVWCAHLY